MSKVEIRPSQIPNAGLGIFAKVLIPKNQVVTEYGGKVIDVNQAKTLKLHGKHTHVLTVSSQYEALDGRVVTEDGFTVEYYTQYDMLGSFANSDKHRANVKYTEKSRSHGRVHPYGGVASKCMVLKATRDIAAGEEILASYGRNYWMSNFEKSEK